jgi:hypothetical protein
MSRHPGTFRLLTISDLAFQSDPSMCVGPTPHRRFSSREQSSIPIRISGLEASRLAGARLSQHPDLHEQADGTTGAEYRITIRGRRGPNRTWRRASNASSSGCTRTCAGHHRVGERTCTASIPMEGLRNAGGQRVEHDCGERQSNAEERESSSSTAPASAEGAVQCGIIPRRPISLRHQRIHIRIVPAGHTVDSRP